MLYVALVVRQAGVIVTDIWVFLRHDESRHEQFAVCLVALSALALACIVLFAIWATLSGCAYPALVQMAKWHCFSLPRGCWLFSGRTCVVALRVEAHAMVDCNHSATYMHCRERPFPS
jgi:hypothetical protein